MLGKIIRTIGVVLVIGALLGLIIINASSKPKPQEKAWTAAMTKGDPEANLHYVMYTDIMCPYCDVFSRLVMDNKIEFAKFLAENKVLFEIRVTDFLYEFGSKSEASRLSAEGAYCAAREDNFWPYYETALTSLWEDYHSHGVGVSKTAPKIEGATLEYWQKIGQKAGLGKKFAKCLAQHDALGEVIEKTEKAATLAGGGLPYFQFGKYTTGGFDPSWDWSYVKQYLNAGLGK